MSLELFICIHVFLIQVKEGQEIYIVIRRKLLFKIRNIIEISMALVLLGLGIYIIIRRYRLHIDNVRLSRK